MVFVIMKVIERVTHFRERFLFTFFIVVSYETVQTLACLR